MCSWSFQTARYYDMKNMGLNLMLNVQNRFYKLPCNSFSDCTGIIMATEVNLVHVSFIQIRLKTGWFSLSALLFKFLFML